MFSILVDLFQLMLLFSICVIWPTTVDVFALKAGDGLKNLRKVSKETLVLHFPSLLYYRKPSIHTTNMTFN